MRRPIKSRTYDPSPPIRKIVKNRGEPFLTNYDNTGLIYLPPDIDPPSLVDLRPDGQKIVAGNRYPIPNRRMQWFTSTLPLGYNRWPSQLRKAY